VAIYLPRGGDYERDLKYIGSSRAIEGALEGAAAGLGLVSKMQGIADNAMSMEMKLENFRTKEAERTATALGALDALGGFGGGDDGDSKGGGRGGRSGKQRGGGGGGGREGMTDADKAQIAEVMNTLAQYEEAKALAGGGEAAPVELPGLEAEAVGPTGQPGEGTERTLDELVQGLPMEQDAEGVWSMRGDEVPSFTTGGGVDTSGRPWVSGISEGQRERLGRYAAEGRESDLDKAIRRYGLEDEPLAKPFTGGAPAPTPRGARMGADERGPAADFLDRPTDALGEGLINPAVAMGFSGRTVLDPISQAYLYDLHRRGSALPTSVANMLGVDRDKMFEPGSVKKSAEYQSQLTQALKRFEANDFAALERVTLQRLISGGLEGLSSDEMQSLAKDLSELSETERNKAIDDLLALPKHLRAAKLAEIRRVRINATSRDPLATLKMLNRQSGRLRGQKIKARKDFNDAKKEFDEAIPGEKTQVLADSLSKAEETANSLDEEYRLLTEDRQKLWNDHRATLGLPPRKVPDEDLGDGDKTVTYVSLDQLGNIKGAFERHAKSTDEESARRFIEESTTVQGLVWSDEAEKAFIEAYSSKVVERQTVEEMKEAVEAHEKRPTTVSRAPAAKKQREKAAREASKLRGKIEQEELSTKHLRGFTAAVDEAERILIAIQKDEFVDIEEITEAISVVRAASRSMRVEYLFEPGQSGRYHRGTGRNAVDDVGELDALAESLREEQERRK